MVKLEEMLRRNWLTFLGNVYRMNRIDYLKCTEFEFERWKENKRHTPKMRATTEDYQNMVEIMWRRLLMFVWLLINVK